MDNRNLTNQVALIDLSKKILVLRNECVMLDADVAEVYGVQTRIINQAVKNNPDKFPNGYIITPDKQELADLRSKFLISSCEDGDSLRSKFSTSSHGGRR